MVVVSSSWLTLTTASSALAGAWATIFLVSGLTAVGAAALGMVDVVVVDEV